mmetsp:Transcript_5809/g.13248  ORF Transcript_5809/g.13248 Transcript_5809/m.13248 type:complete len:243 (+) Transcript_5809:668-1396(+)
MNESITQIRNKVITTTSKQTQSKLQIQISPLQIPHIPQLDNLIGPSARQQKLINGMELQTIHIPIVCILDNLDGHVTLPLPYIPKANELIITTASNHVWITVMPVHILNNVRMIFKRGLGMNNRPTLAILQRLLHIPQTNGIVFRRGDQSPLVLVPRNSTPGHAVPLAGMPLANHIRTGLGTLRGERRMRAQIPNVNLLAGAARGHDKVILGHVSRAIDLAGVGDLHFDVDFADAVYGCVAS